MSKCAVRTGFFVLRDCGEPAVQSCADCQRPACAAHARQADRGLLCLDCWGKERSDLDDDAGVYGYRRSFYTGIGYGPLYGGGGVDPFYDDFDVRAFGNRRHGATAGYGADLDTDYDGDDVGAASFADS